MQKQKINKRILLKNIEIIDITSKGKSIAKSEGRIILVDNAVPGDFCDIEIYKKRRKYWQGKVISYIKYSAKRTKPKCEHFGICGGCKWQNMQYKYQLEFKQKQVINNLRKIANTNLPSPEQMISCSEKYYYRNKMEFTFSNKRWLSENEIKSKDEILDKDALGFHVPGRYDKIIDIKNCHLQREPSNVIRLSIKKFAKENNISFFNILDKKGLLRNLLIRNTIKNEIMVLVQFFYNDEKKINLLMQHIKNSFPNITSLLYIINSKANNTIYDQKVICFSGKNYITEKIDGLVFKIGPKSFFQTNSNQTKKLYRKVVELANINNKDIVYDLYTGTGTIAQYVAQHAKKIIGIDSVEEGIVAARENTAINKIDNCTFFTGDMKEIFTEEFINDNGSPNIIITDPPRDGMHKKVIAQILKINPKRIIYVSCNSATQSRDLELLKNKYHVIKIQTIDMFPQTHHVENILVLESLN